jgi:hypothetical protein
MSGILQRNSACMQMEEMKVPHTALPLATRQVLLVLPSTAFHLYSVNFFYQRPAALSPFAGPGRLGRRPIADYWPVAEVQ